MKLYVSILLGLFLSVLSLSGQSLDRRAEIAYEEGNYKYVVEALEKYKAKKGRITPEMYLPLANSYYYLNDFEEAEKLYKKTRRGLMTAEGYFNYGEMLRKQQRYEEAKGKYRTGKSRRPDNFMRKRLTLGYNACDWALKNKEVMVASTAGVEKADIDVPSQSLGVTYYDKGIVYSSYDPSARKVLKDALGLPILNLYYLSEGEQGKKAKPFSERLASKNHVGSAEFSSDFQTIYFTRLESVGDDYKLKIFSAQFDKEEKEWGDELVLPFCSDEYNCAHPALSNDGKVLFFSSDMKGTLGGMDIFYVKKEDNGWSAPRNIGKVVNTASTEVFPYVTPNGTLSFSSNGHPGLGGLDAFWVEMNEKGEPKAVLNAYAPINSSYDDFAVVINPDDSLGGFVSSNRADGKNDELYELKLATDYSLEITGVDIDSINNLDLRPSTVEIARIEAEAREDSLALVAALNEKQEQKVVVESVDDEAQETEEKRLVDLSSTYLSDIGDNGVLKTYLADALSLQPLESASYALFDKVSGEILMSGTADLTGFVHLDIRSAKVQVNQGIFFEVQTEDGEYNNFSLDLVSDALKGYDENHPILLTPVIQRREKVTEAIVMNEEAMGSAAYPVGSSELTATGKQYMDAWAEFLLKNPEVRIKLKTHTDSRGDVALNFKLSQQRAFSAKRYLISRGVNHLQVIARGYGERYPLIKCVECSDAEHNVNRRIEVEIVKM